jgi:hypothetical protein
MNDQLIKSKTDEQGKSSCPFKNFPLSYPNKCSFAFLVDSLGASLQNHHLINNINSFANKNSNINITIFYKYLAPFETPPKCVTTNLLDLYNYRGRVIITNPSDIPFLIKVPFLTDRYLYLWELSWIGTDGYYDELLPLYNNPRIKYLVRNDYHKKCLADCWGTDSQVVGTYNIDRLSEVILNS